MLKYATTVPLEVQVLPLNCLLAIGSFHLWDTVGSQTVAVKSQKVGSVDKG